MPHKHTKYALTAAAIAAVAAFTPVIAADPVGTDPVAAMKISSE